MALVMLSTQVALSEPPEERHAGEQEGLEWMQQRPQTATIEERLQKLLGDQEAQMKILLQVLSRLEPLNEIERQVGLLLWRSR